jgi:hypothetical protein
VGGGIRKKEMAEKLGRRIYVLEIYSVQKEEKTISLN